MNVEFKFPNLRSDSLSPRAIEEMPRSSANIARWNQQIDQAAKCMLAPAKLVDFVAMFVRKRAHQVTLEDVTRELDLLLVDAKT